MGSDGKEANKNEKPIHQVTVSDYMMGKYEVTQKEWRAIMGNNPSKINGDDLPVERVSWNDIQEFLKRLNKLTGKEYRLPTEAEWEFAARGGHSSNGYKYAGSDNVDVVAWCSQNSKTQSHPVGLKMANELGLYDMSGNVWEWCSDGYGSYGAEAVTNPQAPSIGLGQVMRGGGWSSYSDGCRSTFRNHNTSNYSSYYIGFRIAMPL